MGSALSFAGFLKRLGVAPIRLGLQRRPLLVSLENHRGKRALAYLQKPLTKVIYRTDMDAQFQNMDSARKEHDSHQKRKNKEMQTKLRELGAGEQKGSVPFETLRRTMILDHFRLVASSKDDSRATLFSLAPGSSAVVQSVSNFFAGHVGAMKAEKSLLSAEALEAECEEDMLQMDAAPTFFTVAKSKPSANKLLFVSPGAGRSLAAHHVAVALHPAVPSHGGGYHVSFHEPSKILQDDNLAILSSLGSSSQGIESSLMKWSVNEELSYAVPGQFENSAEVGDMITAMVAGKYIVGQDFYVPPRCVQQAAEMLSQQGILAGNSMGGYALTQQALESLQIQWKVADPSPVCAIRDGLEDWETTVYEL